VGPGGDERLVHARTQHGIRSPPDAGKL